MQNGYHHRGYLPHINVANAAYFVTFRLIDSLPREVVLRLKQRREDIVARLGAQEKSSHTKHLFEWYAAEVDRALDCNFGSAVLQDPRIARLVACALQYFDTQRYQLHAWCVMPNHVHAVVRPVGDHTLEGILHSWKSYTAHEAGKLLRTAGAFWQRESYDHWIRDDAEFAHCIAYTQDNPVVARLCAKPSDWPWSSAAARSESVPPTP